MAIWDWTTCGLPPARLFAAKTGLEILDDVLWCDTVTGDCRIACRRGKYVKTDADGNLVTKILLVPGGILVKWLPQHKPPLKLDLR